MSSVVSHKPLVLEVFGFMIPFLPSPVSVPGAASFRGAAERRERERRRNFLDGNLETLSCGRKSRRVWSFSDPLLLATSLVRWGLVRGLVGGTVRADRGLGARSSMGHTLIWRGALSYFLKVVRTPIDGSGVLFCFFVSFTFLYNIISFLIFTPPFVSFICSCRYDSGVSTLLSTSGFLSPVVLPRGSRHRTPSWPQTKS